MAQIVPGKRTLLTHIGRQVDNWWEYDKDLILKILYDTHRDFFADNLPLRFERIVERADLDSQKVKDICEKLVNENFISKEEIGENIFYKITPEGIEFVEKQMSKV